MLPKGEYAVRGCGDNCQHQYKYCECRLERCPTVDAVLQKLGHLEDAEKQ